MDRRRLLILTYHFPPSAASGSFRMLGFVRHLRRFGWESAVVAPPTMPWEPADWALQAQIPVGLLVENVQYPHGPLSKPLRRLAPYGVWLPKALAASGRVVREHRPHAVLTSGPPHLVHLLGLALSRRHRLPWVVDLRDPWATTGGSEAGQGRRRSWQIWLERAVAAGADTLIANAPRACDQLRIAMPKHADKLEVLTNGYDPEWFPARSATANRDGVINVVHAGELYSGRDPRPFLEAIRGLTIGESWRVRFLGRSSDPAFDLVEEVRKRGLTSAITLDGQVPYEQALQEMVNADILLLLDAPGRLTGVPAKLYEYLGSGRPILALGERDGDMAWVLRESGVLHRIASPGDPIEIGRALSELRGIIGAGPVDAGAGRLRFMRVNLAGQLAEILDRLLEGGERANGPLGDRDALALKEDSIPAP